MRQFIDKISSKGKNSDDKLDGSSISNFNVGSVFPGTGNEKIREAM